MTLIFSEREFQELWDNSTVQVADSFDTIKKCPPQLGKGQKRRIQLRHGISILIHDYQFQDQLAVKLSPAKQFCLEFGFQLAGTRILSNGHYRRAGDHFISLQPLFTQEETLLQQSAGENFLQVDIHIESPSFTWTLLEGHWDWFPEDLRGLMELSIELAGGYLEAGEKLRSSLEALQKRYHYGLRHINPPMQLALQQLLNCPYQGFTKLLYLESKVIELIALRLEQLKSQIIENSPDSQLRDRFLNDDIDRIYHARDILIQNLDNPPSLLELARQVGLNDYKLKRGFRFCFGTTAFGYLHDYRMEQARQLLIDNQMQVNEVARAVGYASRSSFAAAFRKKFGVSPKGVAP